MLPDPTYLTTTPPPELLEAIASRRGRVALIVGAGCSLEAPTNLKLARVYSAEIHRQLVANGTLSDGECPNPEDLSALSSLVFEKRGSQADVVRALPREEFQGARANVGYLLAAALLREGAVNCVLSLNYDLGMSDALTQLGAAEVARIQNPQDLPAFGSLAVVYLHRNVNESDLDLWIVRAEALDDEWRDQWEQVVAQRVTAAPVTVFAGLGSPAAVLTETLGRIRASVSDDALRAFVVDPADESAFKDALRLPPEAHLKMGWAEFMTALGNRVVTDHADTLDAGCQTLNTNNGWGDDLDRAKAIVARVRSKGLVHFGKARASFLLDDRPYTPDDERRQLLPDLILAISLMEQALEAEAEVCTDGVVNFWSGQQIVASALVASGGGHWRWAAIEPQIQQRISSSQQRVVPALAVLGGMMGTPLDDITPPLDLIDGDPGDDIVADTGSVQLLGVDDVRADPAQAARLAS